MNERSLDAIGLQFGTDKSSRHHDYLNFYETIFSGRRNDALTILEVGVFNGASVRTWREYFPNSVIVGCDIEPMAKRFSADRILIEYMDQSNLEDLCRVAVKHGPFDIVIEDGSHLWEHQITTLRTLFPFVRANGLYIVEDLQTNYGDFQNDYRGVAQQSCMTFLKSWLDLHVADNALPLHTVEDAFLRTYGHGAQTITFYKRSCVIEKRALPLPINVTPPMPLYLPEAGKTYARTALVAHLSHVGDVYGSDGYYDLGNDRFTFQGLAVEDPEQALEYRVRGADFNWSPWALSPNFVGTRGRAMILTGVAVWLREAARPHYRLQVLSRFAGDDKVVFAGDGEDCVAPNNADLRGLQIVLERAPAASEDIA